MLGKCREILGSESRNVRDKVELAQGRMQGFDLRNRFGLVICLFNTLPHLQSVEAETKAKVK